MLAHRRVYNEEHAIFRDAVRRFIADQITPNFARWEERGIVDREYWVEGGQRGLLCPQVPSALAWIGWPDRSIKPWPRKLPRQRGLNRWIWGQDSLSAFGRCI